MRPLRLTLLAGIAFTLIGCSIGIGFGIYIERDRAQESAVAESTVEVEPAVSNAEYAPLTISPVPALTVYPIHYGMEDRSLWIYYDGQWIKLPDRVIYMPGGSQ